MSQGRWTSLNVFLVKPALWKRDLSITVTRPGRTDGSFPLEERPKKKYVTSLFSVKPVALERFWPDDLQIWSGPSSNIILARFWRKTFLGDFFCLIGWLISAHQAQKWDLAERKRHGIMYMLLEVFGASRNPKHDVQMYYGSFGSSKHDYKHQNHNFRIAHDQFWSKIISKNQSPVDKNQSPVS